MLLPDEIKTPLDMKAQFGSLNEMEKEKYNYDMKLIDDSEALELLRQQKYEARDNINEDFAKQVTLKNRDLELVQAKAKKSVAEINANAKAEMAQIEADAQLKVEEIKGETLVTKTKEQTKGECDAELIEVKAKNESQKKLMGLPNFLLLLWEPIIADFARSTLHMCHYYYNRVLFRSLYKFTSNFMELKSHLFSFVSESFMDDL